MRLVGFMLAGVAMTTGCGGAPGKAPGPDPGQDAGRGAPGGEYRLLLDGEPQGHFSRARFLELPNYLTTAEAAHGLKIVDLAVYNAPAPAPAPAPGAGGTEAASGSADATGKSPLATATAGKQYRRIVLEQGRVLGPFLTWAFEWEGGKAGPWRSGTIETPSGARFTFSQAWPAAISGREMAWLRATATSAPWRELAVDRLELAAEAVERRQ